MSNYDTPGNDYVSVAKFRLEGVHDQQADEGMTDATLITAALDAQTQATLALACEQRTANLIAAFESMKSSIDHDTAWMTPGSKALKALATWNALGKQIEERLGL